MRTYFFFASLVMLLWGCSQNQVTQSSMKHNKLTPEEEKVILNKETEAPYTGEYYKFTGNGTYICKQCYVPLFLSENKFDSGCGWPSFDEEIDKAVKKTLDEDGVRTEITCANCGAHLGHIFYGEKLTDKNTRYCVNSISMLFIPEKDSTATDTAMFASGCFWGTQYFLDKADGVISTAVGYTGGITENPTYQQVCSGTTGHLEAVEVVFDTVKVSYETLCRYFFETHDFTQTNGQGPDIGEQYLSAIFYRTMEQKAIAEKLIKVLEDKGYKVATTLRPARKFWKAEAYHQDYYDNKGSTPYCHVYRKIF